MAAVVIGSVVYVALLINGLVELGRNVDAHGNPAGEVIALRFWPLVFVTIPLYGIGSRIRKGMHLE